MSWNISQQEFESVLSLSDEKRYFYFLKKVADWEELWSLRNQDGWVLAADPDGHEVVPVWPHERFAQACIEGNWKDCKPSAIRLSEWMERWIPGMARDSRQVAVFQTPQDKGIVIHPDRLNDDLRDECQQYE